MYQVVVDTNVLYAALRSRRGASYRLLSLMGDGRWQMNLSVQPALECEDAVKRPGSGVGLSAAGVDGILDFICAEKEGVALEQFIASALAEKMAAWKTVDYLRT